MKLTALVVWLVARVAKGLQGGKDKDMKFSVLGS